MIPQLPPAIYIETNDALVQLTQQLEAETLLAIDTESNNLYAYRGRVCLIQLSTREQDYIIDPLMIDNMQPFGALLANPKIEKIFHAAEYDVLCLKRDFAFEVVQVFDTMVAARLCGLDTIGLGDLLYEFFDVEVDKSHQTDDWGKRPLQEESLKYAQIDTHYLPRLRDMLRHELGEMSRLEEAAEVFKDALHLEVKPRDFDPDGYWKIGRPRSLSRRQMAGLRELYLLRDQLAQEADLPPFKIFTNEVLINLVRKQPRNHSHLARIEGLGSAQVRIHGKELLQALQRGRQSRTPKPPKVPKPDPLVSERYIALHTWRKEQGIERGINSHLVLAKQTLWAIAEAMPENETELLAVEGMGEWRVKTYGESLLELLDTLR